MPIDPLSVSPNQVDSDAMRTKINELISDNSSVTVGDSPPASPGEGDLWFDEGVAAMYVYVAAPTNAWIQANPAGGASGSSGVSNIYSTGWADSHGGVAVANGSTHTITHNLGTTDVIVAVYVNSSGSDTNAQMFGDSVHNSAGVQFDAGSSVTSLAPNSVVIQLGQDGYNHKDSNGGFHTTSLANKYIKVVVFSSSSGGTIPTFTYDPTTEVLQITT